MPGAHARGRSAPAAVRLRGPAQGVEQDLERLAVHDGLQDAAAHDGAPEEVTPGLKRGGLGGRGHSREGFWSGEDGGAEAARPRLCHDLWDVRRGVVAFSRRVSDAATIKLRTGTNVDKESILMKRARRRARALTRARICYRPAAP